MFGNFLLQYRINNGMTQAELAKKLSISQNTISQYESGKRNPTIKRVTCIASVLGYSVADIMSTPDLAEHKAHQRVKKCPSWTQKDLVRKVK